jgi:phosphotransferase system HPr (HPr) family protein
MQTEDVTIINRLGLHARAASVFVKKSAQFASTVTVI